ncbi:hypothetical protein BT63DRAFT_459030 [Microthyrium microscopicum]|uniref:Actin-like ATPase domain-containing protein n=1 Tax=Microthyrium microscopicum TaxID=703497 RepID=A0A6A6U3B7_9PEZI|nr:hypothetical protein BT63DRAFT_459030 [Microthyrium microscopicum]
MRFSWAFVVSRLMSTSWVALQIVTGVEGAALKNVPDPRSERSSFVYEKVHVAVDLSTSYGAIWVTYPNEEDHWFTGAEAPAEYKEAMAQLSIQPAPYTHVGQKTLSNQIRANISPKSLDIAPFAKMISLLLLQVETYLGFRPTEIAVIAPHLKGLTEDHLIEACSQANIAYFPWPDRKNPIVYETQAVFAGYGHGLCKSWDWEEQCRREEQEMEEYDVYTVHYSGNALTTSLTRKRSAQDGEEDKHFENFDLGFDARPADPSNDAPESRQFWKDVEAEMKRVVEQRGKDDVKPTLVIMHGDKILERFFLEALRNAIHEGAPFLGDPPLDYWDVIYAPARGAAELMRRARK